MKILGIIFMLSSSIPFYLGFDKMLNYKNSEYFSTLSKNAYVGGDAYNYIINANYFTGYMVLGLALILIGGVILICDQINQLRNNNNNKDNIIEEPETKEVILKDSSYMGQWYKLIKFFYAADTRWPKEEI